mgnify:FL=1
MKRIVLLLLAAALAGCCTVKISKENGRDMVEVKNCGWKFLGLLAIATGNPEEPNNECCLLFTDSLFLDVNMMLLDNAMKKYGYRSFRNISTYTTRENALFIFSRQAYHTSAELVK